MFCEIFQWALLKILYNFNIAIVWKSPKAKIDLANVWVQLKIQTHQALKMQSSYCCLPSIGWCRGPFNHLSLNCHSHCQSLRACICAGEPAPEAPTNPAAISPCALCVSKSCSQTQKTQHFLGKTSFVLLGSELQMSVHIQVQLLSVSQSDRMSPQPVTSIRSSEAFFSCDLSILMPLHEVCSDEGR